MRPIVLYFLYNDFSQSFMLKKNNVSLLMADANLLR